MFSCKFYLVKDSLLEEELISLTILEVFLMVNIKEIPGICYSYVFSNVAVSHQYAKSRYKISSFL